MKSLTFNTNVATLAPCIGAASKKFVVVTNFLTIEMMCHTWAMWMFLALSLWLVARREGTEASMVSEAIANIAGVSFFARKQSKQFGVPLRPINGDIPGGRFKNTYELLNLRALKFSPMNKIHIFQCMVKIFCVEFQREPLKFQTKYLTHTLKDITFIQHWNFKSS